MAGAFQSNAFQNDAFQTDAAFTGGFAQAQCQVKHTYQAYAQAQCDVKAIGRGFGQAQCTVATRYSVFAQAQCDIKATSNGFAQSQVDIKATSFAFSQAQCDIKATGRGFAQAQCSIATKSSQFSQTQADIKATSRGFAQAQCTVKAVGRGFAQSNAYILNRHVHAQAQAEIVVGECFDILVQDTFSRTLSGTLGTPDIGPDYDESIPSSYAGASTDGNILTVSGPDPYSFVDARIPITHGTDFVASIDFKPNIDAFAAYALLFFNASNIGPQLFENNGTATPQTKLVIIMPNSFSEYEDFITLDDTEWYTLKVKVSGYNFKTKIWKRDSEPEPDWLTDDTDPGPDLLADGQIGFYADTGDNNSSQLLDNLFLGIPCPVSGPFAQAQAFIIVDPLLFDTFSVNTVADMAPPDIGPAWAPWTPFNDFTMVVEENGAVHPTAGVGDWIAAVSLIQTRNTDTYIVFSSDGGNASYIEFDARVDSTGAGFGDIYVSNDTLSDDWRLAALGSGVFTGTAIDAYTITPGVKYSARLVVIERTVKFKIWPLQDAEPGTWLLDAYLSDGTVIATAGSGFYIENDAGEVSIDTWLVTKLPEMPSGQAQASITRGITTVQAQAQAKIKRTTRAFAQAQASIFSTRAFAQAKTDVKVIQPRFAQAQTTIAAKFSKSAQAQAKIHRVNYSFGLAQAHITGVTSRGYGQANALITSTHKQAYAQSQAFVRRSIAFAQAQAMINAHFKFAQAQVKIRRTWIRVAQAQATIKYRGRGFAQANALIINGSKYAQAQALVKHGGNQGYAQAQANVRRSIGFAQVQAFVAGGKYLVRYNQHLLPGYAQAEAFDSGMQIQDHDSPYNDGSLSEYIGLQNKTITITMKIVEPTYAESKRLSQQAGTMLNSTRSWAKLYVQASDRHYLAMAKSMKMQQDARNRTLDYTAEFTAKPWLISDQQYIASGTGLITIPRTIYDGGYTPATVRITGTNTTVSGYTSTVPFTGFIGVSGTVTDLIVTTQPFTATIGGVNSLSHIYNPDYELYIGPETTYVDVSGATNVTITYNNRWYL